MLSTLPTTISPLRRAAPTPVGAPLAQSYDPAVRGPLLLAADGRGTSDAALIAARAIAQRLGVNVEVVGVLEPLPTYLMAPEVPILPPEVEAERRAAMILAIEQRLAAVGGGAERWPLLIGEGDTSRTIVRVARERDATLIVVGAGRHAPRAREYGGELARRIVRKADRPVLAVNADFQSLPTTAVVGMDFSPASVRAARAALLMLGGNGRLVLVHVRATLDLPSVPATLLLRDANFNEQVSRWRQEQETETSRLFERLREELRPSVPVGVTVETRVRSGVAQGELLAVADELGADLVAVGTHGPGIIERFFVGSVALDVVRDCSRAVLVAPAPPPVECERLDLRLRGTAEITRTEDWAAALEAFTLRNAGRRVRLEVDDPDIGAQVQESGFALLGVAYDRKDRSVEVMMGHPDDRTRHVTRTIPRADDLALYATPDGKEHALRVARGRSQTLITFVE